EGLVFFPGFAPGWGMSARRFDTPAAQPSAQSLISQLMGSTVATSRG
ncbi:MAG: XRE family transcriptional regulator, partial [Pseudomonadales bacterium]|nr:XRE family transcriptional regulator [Pseudomonadales bacterium]